ncbi:MAG: hypothetical protein R3E90_08090 [Marinicella sp.]|nr:hypothetical protein [Xanthomonadales bacterium]
MIETVITVIAGLLAGASLLKRFSKDANQYLQKLSPYQTFIGLAVLALGLWNLIQLIRLMLHGGFSVMSTAVVGLQVVVGFLLCFGWLGQLLFSRSPETEAKSKVLQQKLAPYQGVLGLVLAVLAVFNLVQQMRAFAHL